jgi:hypothetical protein
MRASELTSSSGMLFMPDRLRMAPAPRVLSHMAIGLDMPISGDIDLAGDRPVVQHRRPADGDELGAQVRKPGLAGAGAEGVPFPHRHEMHVRQSVLHPDA